MSVKDQCHLTCREDCIHNGDSTLSGESKCYEECIDKKCETFDESTSLWGWDTIKDNVKVAGDAIIQAHKDDETDDEDLHVSPLVAQQNYMTCISKCGQTDYSCYSRCNTVYQKELLSGGLVLGAEITALPAVDPDMEAYAQYIECI
jgi:hypothetical protein